MQHLLNSWFNDHNITPLAYKSLLDILAPGDVGPGEPGYGEGAVMKKVRLETNKTGGLLLRNNSGVWTDPRGIPVRYGLGNDSSKINKKFKSSDLIGLTPLQVEPRHVGQVWGVFTAIETKKPGWRYKGGERATAQLFFLNTIKARGGIGTFATCAEDYTRSILEFYT